MCLGKPFQPNNNKQTIYELYGFRRVGIYAIFQIIFIIFCIIIISLGEKIFININIIYIIIIGIIIITILSFLPNGKPFPLNLYRMGRVYIMFDGNKREIILITTHFGSIFIKPKLKIISSYSQFRGIAVHHQTGHLLLLCKREESLLLKSIGECLPNNHKNIETILEEISLFWFQHNQNNAFFGKTYIDFSNGLCAEGNVIIDIDYDFYLKRSDTWKPKNNINININKQKEKQINNNDNNQYLDIIPKKDKKNVSRFQSVNGAEVDVGSDDDNDIVVDYV